MREGALHTYCIVLAFLSPWLMRYKVIDGGIMEHSVAEYMRACGEQKIMEHIMTSACVACSFTLSAQ